MNCSDHAADDNLPFECLGIMHLTRGDDGPTGPLRSTRRIGWDKTMAYVVNIDTDEYFVVLVHEFDCGHVRKDAIGEYRTIWDAISEGARAEGVMTARVGRSCPKRYGDIVVVSASSA